MKILLVDDSRTIRNIQKNVLAKLNYTEIDEAEDGVQALTKYHASKPDLMLVDWNMPNMDGITLIKKIREIDKVIPMIMCTMKTATHMSDTLLSRGYDPRGTVTCPPGSWSALDFALVLVAVGILIVGFVV